MTKRTNEGEQLTQLILEIFQVNGAMIDAGNRLTKPVGLTSARWQVMGAIDLAGQPLTVAQVARRMGLSRQGVQRIVNDLEKLGMVRFESNIDHKRSPLVAISEDGEKVMVDVNAAQAAWVNTLAKGMNANDVQRAVTLLETLRKSAEQQEERKE